MISIGSQDPTISAYRAPSELSPEAPDRRVSGLESARFPGPGPTWGKQVPAYHRLVQNGLRSGALPDPLREGSTVVGA